MRADSSLALSVRTGGTYTGEPDELQGGIPAVESLLSVQAAESPVIEVPRGASTTAVAASAPESDEPLGQASGPSLMITNAVAPDVISLASSTIVFHNSYGSGVN